MAKPKKTYVCGVCGHSQSTWFGTCQQCGEAGTVEERVADAQRAGRTNSTVVAATFEGLGSVGDFDVARVSSGIGELDRVLGGGLVPGSLLVLGGEPGAGKTTLATEVEIHLGRKGGRVAYISGEESTEQVKMRFERLGAGTEGDILLSDEVGVERICEAIARQNFDLVVIDSIQQVLSEDVPGPPGSVSQVRECTHKLIARSQGDRHLGPDHRAGDQVRGDRGPEDP